MAVLVLRLSGPLQSWGTEPVLKEHPTDLMPSKSGVIGMLAAAMGRKRNEEISDLAALRFGAREDHPGQVMTDYQVSHEWRRDEKGKIYSDKSYVGNRFYIQNACYVVAVEGPEELLGRCEEALEHPVYPPYLGRRCCVPDAGMVLGIFGGSLEEVLEALPRQPLAFLVEDPSEENTSSMRACVEAFGGADRTRYDNPISFSMENRQYSYRMEKEYYIAAAK